MPCLKLLNEVEGFSTVTIIAHFSEMHCIYLREEITKQDAKLGEELYFASAGDMLIADAMVCSRRAP